MSSSNENDRAKWGTIFMGPNPLHETTLAKVENNCGGTAWNPETEAEYMERVREKAKEKAREILEKARSDALELREKARQEGYDEGMRQASDELEEFRSGMGQAVGAVLSAIEGQRGELAAAWRGELVTLMRLAVEKIVDHELSENRAELMAALFDGAVERLGQSARNVVRVSPEDEPVVADIIASAASAVPANAFTVRADQGLEPGSLIVENDESMADNSLKGRRALVEEALAALVLPATKENAPQDNASLARPDGASSSATPPL